MIHHHPNPGEVLICAFDNVAIGAEMIKRRPSVVVSRRDSHARGLVTVVPLSTTPPHPPRAWHHPLPHLKIAGWPDAAVTWAKCDMLATVSVTRLNKPYIKTRRDGRIYRTLLLAAEDLAAVQDGVRAYLGL